MIPPGEDPITLLFRLGFGPWLFPCRGKVPAIDAWNTFPPVEEELVRTWVELNFNLALRTGINSGVVVIDNDQPKHPDGPQDYVLPVTGLIVLSSTGSRHGYYRCPTPAAHNSTSVVAPHVDVRGEGGYVMIPPSVHPETHQPYRWEATGDPGALPADLIARLVTPAHQAPAPVRVPSGLGYASTALVRETARVRVASDGARNDTLNKAAFSLGQLVAGGALDSEQVRSELAAAASVAGLSEREATKTIDSGLKGGAGSPRTVPDRTGSHRIAPERAATATPTDVLVPGSHSLPSGEYVEQGNGAFADAVLLALTPGAIYRRSNVVGELHDGQFVQIESDRLRSIVDASVRLTAGKPPSRGSESDKPIIVYRSCSHDNASVLLRYAAVRGSARELKHIARYPVCVGADFLPAKPGWNAESGVFLACDRVPATLALDESKALLDDLVCDFPFASDADRANYIGLLVTAIVRPAIHEPVPMHLIGAPVAGSGKSKLAEVVLGCGLLGRPLPATQIGVREEEREKRITAAMLAGDSVINLDNLHDFVDSPSLASLLTCSVYRGRELGHSRMLELPNDATVVGSGNNVHATDEISRRIVPIMLQPSMESPETRQDYRHPQLRAYVESQIDRTRGAIFGLVAHWLRAGRPVGTVAVGSFERWAAVVGGIMAAAGYDKHLSNLTTWRTTADDTNAELRAFVALWAGSFQGWVTVGDLFKLADDNELFTRRLTQPSEAGRRTTFGRVVISSIANRIVSGHMIEVDGQGRFRKARLVHQ